MPIGGMVTDWSGLGVGAEVGQGAGSTGVDPGAVDDDDRGQPGDPLGLAPGRGGRPGCRRRSGRRGRRSGRSRWTGLEGLDAVVRAGPAGLDLGDLERRVAGDGDPGHLQAVATGVRSPGLCGGAPATTNQTRSSPHASRHCSARIRCPRWIGSNVPPNSPSRIAVDPRAVVGGRRTDFVWTNVQKSGELAGESQCRTGRRWPTSCASDADDPDDRPDHEPCQRSR